MRRKDLCIFICVTALLFCGCGGNAPSSGGTSGEPKSSSESADPSKLRDSTPEVKIPEAPGTQLYTTDVMNLDASHVSEGYVMMQYNGTNEKVKFQVCAPGGTDYTYLVKDYGSYHVYPLPGGNGSYTFKLLESVSVADSKYAIAFTEQVDVTITDEFSPFLYPNYYVNFAPDSACVAKGKELADGCTCDLDVVSNIYNYVIKNISYDTNLAENVEYGYTPDPDETLKSGTGICFDYASVMSSMLRSQRIPTKLVVGYSGEAYHAWISCYVDEIGWVDNIIEFDGKNWSLMDPTLGSTNQGKDQAVKKYVGDGSNYVTKYTY